MNSGLLPSEVGRDFTPLLGVPLDEGKGKSVLLQPCLGTCDKGKEGGVLRCTCEGGLYLALRCPDDSGAAIAIDGHGEPFLLQQCHGMDNSQELTDIVRAVNRTIVEDLLP